MELKTYFEIMKRRKWIIAGTLLGAVLVAMLANRLITPIYEATSILRVAGSTTTVTDSVGSRNFDLLMNTYAEIAVSQPVLNKLKQTLDLKDLAKRDIVVELIQDTELLELTARALTPEAAQSIANTLAQIMVDQSRQLYIGGGESAQSILQEQLDQAERELEQAQAEYEVVLAQIITEQNELLKAEQDLNRAQFDYEARLAQVSRDVRQTDLTEADVAQDKANRERLDLAEQKLDQAQLYYDSLRIRPSSYEGQLAPYLQDVNFKEQIYTVLLENYEQARLNEAIRINAITVVEPAGLPREPTQPRTSLNLALGILVGLFAGVGLAILVDSLDSSIRGRDDVERLSTLPILVEIPDSSTGWGGAFRRRSLDPENNLEQSEAFRTLRANLVGGQSDSPAGSIMVTSSEPGEGKSTIVAKLAASFAQTGASVVVVDSDLRMPAQHEIWKVSDQIGLTTVLTGEAHLDEAMQASPIAEVKIITSGPTASNTSQLLGSPETAALLEQLRDQLKVADVQVLTSGPISANASDLLGSPKMSSIVEQLTAKFDYVLFDTPDLLSVADAHMLAKYVDSVILVVALKRVSAGELEQSLHQLAASRAKVAGIVINRSKPSRNHRQRYSNSRPLSSLNVRQASMAEEAQEFESSEGDSGTSPGPMEGYGIARGDLPAASAATASTIAEASVADFVTEGTGKENGSSEHETDFELERGAFESSMDMSLKQLGIPNRAVDALEKEGIYTVPHILGRMTAGGDQALLSVKGFGPKALTTLKESFRAYGIDIDQVAGQ